MESLVRMNLVVLGFLEVWTHNGFAVPDDTQKRSVRILYGLGRWRVNASDSPRPARIGENGQGFR